MKTHGRRPKNINQTTQPTHISVGVSRKLMIPINNRIKLDADKIDNNRESFKIHYILLKYSIWKLLQPLAIHKSKKAIEFLHYPEYFKPLQEK